MNLPPLFKEIIENDAELVREVKLPKVVNFSTAVRVRNRKRELIRAADRLYYPSKEEQSK